MLTGEKECCPKYLYAVSPKSCRGSISSDNRINSRVNRSGKVPFYFLLLELYGEAKNIPLIARLLSEGKMERINKKRYSKLNGKLFKAWEDYNNRVMTTTQLLRACASLYGLTTK